MDGAWRKVEIRVVRPGLKDVKVRTREGYFAPFAKRTRPRASATRGPETASSALWYDFARARPLHARLRLRAARRPGARHRGAGRGARPRRRAPGAARRHRVGQDLHDGADHRAGEPPDARDGPQQDPGGAALPGVPALLPRQRGRVLRQLLRLLPARGLRPGHRPYIEKEATINDEIDRMRLSATRSLFERRDVIIVASVSCIYGLGSPEAYYGMMLPLERGQRIDREQILRKLVEIQYERNDTSSAAARSASAATSSRSTRRTRSRRSASSCSATRSTSWSPSIR